MKDIAKGFFEYVVLHTCQYPMLFSGESPKLCGMPAPFLGYWVDEDGNATDKQYLCEVHVTIIEAREEIGLSLCVKEVYV